MFYSIYIVYLLTIAFILPGSMLYTWRRRNVPGAQSLTWFLGAASFWVLCDVLSALSPTERWAYILESKLRFIGVAFGIVFVFLVAAEYLDLRQWFKPHRLVALFIIPFLTQLIIWFGPEDVFLANVTYRQENGLYLLESREIGAWFLVYSAYGYVLIIAGLGLLLRHALQASQVYRRQALLLLSGLLLIILVGSVRTFGSGQILQLDWIAVAFSVTIIIWSFAIFRYRLLDITPIAHTTLIKNMPDIIIVIDSQDRIVELNPAAEQYLTNQHVSNVLGMSIHDAYADWKKFTRQLVEMKDGIVENFVDIDNHRFYFSLGATTVLDHNNNPRGRLLVVRDITALKEAEQHERELRLERERIRLLQNFVTQVGHHFKTPLSVINTISYLMSESADHDERNRYRQQIEGQIDIISNLVNSMTILSTLDTPHKIDLTQFDLNDVVRKALLLVNQNKQQTIIQGLDQPLPICGHADYLQRAVLNILDNAIRFTPPSGTIRVQTEKVDHEALICISDTGEGIDDEHLPHIFSRFYRADKVGTTHGLGLGLPMSKSIVDFHNGRIEVTSQAKQGSVFKIYLPLDSSGSSSGQPDNEC